MELIDDTASIDHQRRFSLHGQDYVPSSLWHPSHHIVVQNANSRAERRRSTWLDHSIHIPVSSSPISSANDLSFSSTSDEDCGPPEEQGILDNNGSSILQRTQRLIIEEPNMGMMGENCLESPEHQPISEVDIDDLFDGDIDGSLLFSSSVIIESSRNPELEHNIGQQSDGEPPQPATCCFDNDEANLDPDGIKTSPNCSEVEGPVANMSLSENLRIMKDDFSLAESVTGYLDRQNLTPQISVDSSSQHCKYLASAESERPAPISTPLSLLSTLEANSTTPQVTHTIERKSKIIPVQSADSYGGIVVTNQFSRTPRGQHMSYAVQNMKSHDASKSRGAWVSIDQRTMTPQGNNNDIVDKYPSYENLSQYSPSRHEKKQESVSHISQGSPIDPAPSVSQLRCADVKMDIDTDTSTKSRTLCCSVEQGQVADWQIRESTPAYEDRSSSPSPTSFASEHMQDVGMQDRPTITHQPSTAQEDSNLYDCQSRGEWSQSMKYPHNAISSPAYSMRVQISTSPSPLKAKQHSVENYNLGRGSAPLPDHIPAPPPIPESDLLLKVRKRSDRRKSTSAVNANVSNARSTTIGTWDKSATVQKHQGQRCRSRKVTKAKQRAITGAIEGGDFQQVNNRRSARLRAKESSLPA